MNKNPTLTVASPFKFGFYAGLGFFVASLLTSGLTILAVGLLGLGTLGAMLGSAHVTSSSSTAAPSQAGVASASSTHLERWQR